MIQRPFIVVSGLPASGKTTVGSRLAAALRMPLLDKDDILEALFETAGPVDAEKRSQLSRASDVVLARLSAASSGAVLVSHWRHASSLEDSGTPIGFLRSLSTHIVEVHCVCPPEIAVQRFTSRQRHPGHNDGERAPRLVAQFQHLAGQGPLGIGRTVVVRTDRPFDFDFVAENVRTALATED